MEKNFQKAFNALEKIGCPVIEGWDDPDKFVISAENNYPVVWADYYCEFPGGLDDFGVSNKINKILDKYGLFAEWINPGLLGVNEA
jgi:hypothetical protein